MPLLLPQSASAQQVSTRRTGSIEVRLATASRQAQQVANAGAAKGARAIETLRELAKLRQTQPQLAAALNGAGYSPEDVLTALRAEFRPRLTALVTWTAEGGYLSDPHRAETLGQLYGMAIQANQVEDILSGLVEVGGATTFELTTADTRLTSNASNDRRESLRQLRDAVRNDEALAVAVTSTARWTANRTAETWLGIGATLETVASTTYRAAGQNAWRTYSAIVQENDDPTATTNAMSSGLSIDAAVVFAEAVAANASNQQLTDLLGLAALSPEDGAHLVALQGAGLRAQVQLLEYAYANSQGAWETWADWYVLVRSLGAEADEAIDVVNEEIASADPAEILAAVRDSDGVQVVAAVVARVVAMLDPVAAIMPVILVVYNVVDFPSEFFQVLAASGWDATDLVDASALFQGLLETESASMLTQTASVAGLSNATQNAGMPAGVLLAAVYLESASGDANTALGLFASHIEGAMAQTIPVVIDFLANVIGLDQIVDALRNGVGLDPAQTASALLASSVDVVDGFNALLDEQGVANLDDILTFGRTVDYPPVPVLTAAHARFGLGPVEYSFGMRDAFWPTPDIIEAVSVVSQMPESWVQGLFEEITMTPAALYDQARQQGQNALAAVEWMLGQVEATATQVIEIVIVYGDGDVPVLADIAVGPLGLTAETTVEAIQHRIVDMQDQYTQTLVFGLVYSVSNRVLGMMQALFDTQQKLMAAGGEPVHVLGGARSNGITSTQAVAALVQNGHAVAEAVPWMIEAYGWTDPMEAMGDLVGGGYEAGAAIPRVVGSFLAQMSLDVAEEMFNEYTDNFEIYLQAYLSAVGGMDYPTLASGMIQWGATPLDILNAAWAFGMSSEDWIEWAVLSQYAQFIAAAAGNREVLVESAEGAEDTMVARALVVGASAQQAWDLAMALGATPIATLRVALQTVGDGFFSFVDNVEQHVLPIGLGPVLAMMNSAGASDDDLVQMATTVFNPSLSNMAVGLNPYLSGVELVETLMASARGAGSSTQQVYTQTVAALLATDRTVDQASLDIQTLMIQEQMVESELDEAARSLSEAGMVFQSVVNFVVGASSMAATEAVAFLVGLGIS